MKKFLAMILAASMMFGAATAVAEDLEVLTEFGDVAAEDAEYAPRADYDKYSLVEYYIENADATVLVTCSAKADDSEYVLEFSFYGDDQEVVMDGEGNVISDKTGFMGGDAPSILAAIKEAGLWSAIPSVVDFENELTSEDADYEPNADYDKWTLAEYYIESADATVLVTCSAKADDSEYFLAFSFYGDDQEVVITKDGTVTADKSGFMGTDAPNILSFILESNTVWADIVK